MATLKITGVDERVAQFVSQRADELHFKGQAEYLRNLIREDMSRVAAERRERLQSIVGPLHAHAEAQGYTEEQLAEVIERARNEVQTSRRDRIASETSTK